MSHEIDSKAGHIAREIVMQGAAKDGERRNVIRMEELSPADRQRLEDAMMLDALEHGFQQSVKAGVYLPHFNRPSRAQRRAAEAKDRRK